MNATKFNEMYLISQNILERLEQNIDNQFEILYQEWSDYNLYVFINIQKVAISKSCPIIMQ